MGTAATSAPDTAELAGARFRRVAGRFATGVAVATTSADGGPAGMTVNSFTTVSLDPPLLLVCLHERSRLLAGVRRAGGFGVTVLAADQCDTARWFASRQRPVGPAAFAGIRYHADAQTGCPVLSDGVAYFGCAAQRLFPAGDHVVLIGAVRSCGLLRAAPPLLFVDGRYAEPGPDVRQPAAGRA